MKDLDRDDQKSYSKERRQERAFEQKLKHAYQFDDLDSWEDEEYSGRQPLKGKKHADR